MNIKKIKKQKLKKRQGDRKNECPFRIREVKERNTNHKNKKKNTKGKKGGRILGFPTIKGSISDLKSGRGKEDGITKSRNNELSGGGREEKSNVVKTQISHNPFCYAG